MQAPLAMCHAHLSSVYDLMTGTCRMTVSYLSSKAVLRYQS